MARSKINKDKLTLPKKKEVVKKTAIVNDEKINTIHPVVREANTRITADIPDSTYKAIKNHCTDNRETLKDYFIRLAKKDLGLE